MVEDCAHLFDGDTREQLHKLGDLDSVFQILKES